MPKVNLISDDDDVVVEGKKQTTNRTKSFKNDDLITCVSVTAGQLIMVGAKSNNKYKWDGIGAKEEVEYRDLVALVHSHNSLIYKPRFIIQNDDFLAKFDDILSFYGSLYTPEDIKSVLDMPAEQMRETIKKMPIGARDALKGIAITMIEQGSLDSIQRIKVIDEIFGTEMLLKMTN